MTTYQVMPPIGAATMDALRSSIEKYGIIVPIVVDHEGNVVDGHQRLEIANELGIHFRLIVIVPEQRHDGLTREQAIEAGNRMKTLNLAARKVPYLFEFAEDYNVVYMDVPEGTDLHDVARSLNLDRRHLSTEQRRQIVTDLRSGGHSLRAIAGAVGVSKSQVAKDIIKTTEVSTSGHLTVVADPPKRVTGKDRKSYPATKSKALPPLAEIAPSVPAVANDELPLPLGDMAKVLAAMVFHVEEVLAGRTQFAEPEKVNDFLALTGALFSRLEYLEKGQKPPWYFYGEVLGKPIAPPDAQAWIGGVAETSS